MGNTGDEIAPDLCEAGVPFAPSVRSPVIDVGTLARIRAGAADTLLTEITLFYKVLFIINTPPQS